MCMEDVRIMRKTQIGQRNVGVQLTSTPLLDANPNRIALVISCPSTNRVTLMIDQAAVLDLGITLYPLGTPFVLSLMEHGNLVTRALNAITTVAPQNVNVWEAVLPDNDGTYREGFDKVKKP